MKSWDGEWGTTPPVPMTAASPFPWQHLAWYVGHHRLFTAWHHWKSCSKLWQLWRCYLYSYFTLSMLQLIKSCCLCCCVTTLVPQYTVAPGCDDKLLRSPAAFGMTVALPAGLGPVSVVSGLIGCDTSRCRARAFVSQYSG